MKNILKLILLFVFVTLNVPNTGLAEETITTNITQDKKIQSELIFANQTEDLVELQNKNSTDSSFLDFIAYPITQSKKVFNSAYNATTETFSSIIMGASMGFTFYVFTGLPGTIKTIKETIKLFLYFVTVTAILYGTDFALELLTYYTGLPTSILSYQFGTIFNSTINSIKSLILSTPEIFRMLPKTIPTVINFVKNTPKYFKIFVKIVSEKCFTTDSFCSCLAK